MQPDLETVRRQLHSLVRAADRIRQHAADLWTLGWEPTTAPDGERVHGGHADHTPKTGDPRARRLFDQIATNVAQMEAELVGYERTMTALFFAGSQSAEASRGSLISRDEHDRLVGNQRRRRTNGEYTPASLVDQPAHPGKRR